MANATLFFLTATSLGLFASSASRADDLNPEREKFEVQIADDLYEIRITGKRDDDGDIEFEVTRPVVTGDKRDLAIRLWLLDSEGNHVLTLKEREFKTERRRAHRILAMIHKEKGNLTKAQEHIEAAR